MKRMCKYIIFLLLASAVSYAKVIGNEDVKETGYVILIGTYKGPIQAQRIAKKFPDDQILISQDNEFYTVKLVNMATKKEAKKKLVLVKKSIHDAVLWKKIKKQSIKHEAVKNNDIQKVVASTNTETLNNNLKTIDGLILVTTKEKCIGLSGPAPIGKEIQSWEKKITLLGFYAEDSHWFIVQKEQDGSSWKSLAAPVWINTSSIQ